MLEIIKKIFYIFFFTSHRAVFLYKLGSWFYSKEIVIVAYIIKHLSITLNGCDISPAAIIGDNVKFAHTIGIVIGEGVIVGDNVKFYQNVTLGTKDGSTLEYPTIGDNVILFAGATIVGSVTIGDNAVVGANSLVLKDIPSNSLALGNPSKIKKNFKL